MPLGVYDYLTFAVPPSTPADVHLQRFQTFFVLIFLALMVTPLPRRLPYTGAPVSVSKRQMQVPQLITGDGLINQETALDKRGKSRKSFT
jgi:hypothetical protein